MLVSKGFCNKYHKLGDLKQQKFIFTVLEDRSLKSSIVRAMLPLKHVGQFFLAFSELLVVWWQSLVFLGLKMHHFYLLSLYAFLPVCIFTQTSLYEYVCSCVQITPFYKNTSHIGFSPTLTAVALQSLPLSPHAIFLFHESVSISILFFWGH